MFQKIVMPPFSGSSSPRRVLGIFDSEDEPTTTLSKYYELAQKHSVISQKT